MERVSVTGLMDWRCYDDIILLTDISDIATDFSGLMHTLMQRTVDLPVNLELIHEDGGD
jgi:hypothetical protein